MTTLRAASARCVAARLHAQKGPTDLEGRSLGIRRTSTGSSTRGDDADGCRTVAAEPVEELISRRPGAAVSLGSRTRPIIHRGSTAARPPTIGSGVSGTASVACDLRRRSPTQHARSCDDKMGGGRMSGASARQRLRSGIDVPPSSMYRHGSDVDAVRHGRAGGRARHHRLGRRASGRSTASSWLRAAVSSSAGRCRWPGSHHFLAFAYAPSMSSSGTASGSAAWCATARV